MFSRAVAFRVLPIRLFRTSRFPGDLMHSFANAAAVLLLSILFPVAALAAPTTITFDRGFEDTTITDPSGEYHAPYAWIEEGIRITGLWLEDVGTPQGQYGLGHTHGARNGYQEPSQVPFGDIAEYTHAYTDDLQGLLITLESGGSFDLVSLEYDVWFLELPGDPQLQRLPWSYAATDPKIIIAETFDPTAADFESQWTAFDAISGLNAPGDGDWQTLDLNGAGFTNLTSIMISQTAAQTWFDNIVINVHDVTPVPEPSTAVLFGLGLAGLARRSDRDRAATARTRAL